MRCVAGRLRASRFADIRGIDTCDRPGLARELLDRLERRKGSVGCDTELGEAACLRQYLSFERTHRGVVGLHRIAELLAHPGEVCREVSEPPIELLAQLTDGGGILR